MLQKDHANKMVSEGNERGTFHKVQLKRNLLQEVIQMKLQQFCHIFRMSDCQKIKLLVSGMTDERNSGLTISYIG